MQHSSAAAGPCWDLFLTCFPNNFRGPVPVDKYRHAEDEDTPDQVEGYANLCAFEEHHLKGLSSQMVMRDLLTFMRRSFEFFVNIVYVEIILK